MSYKASFPRLSYFAFARDRDLNLAIFGHLLIFGRNTGAQPGISMIEGETYDYITY